MEDVAPVADAAPIETPSVGGGETPAPVSVPSNGSLLGGSPSAVEPVTETAPDAPIDLPKSWQDSLPDDFRDNKNINKYNSLDDLLRGHDNLSRKIGEKNLEMPGEDASTADWDKFYARIGRPESVDGYTEYSPEMVVDSEGNEIAGFEFDKEQLAGVQRDLHAAGATDKVMKVVMDSYANISTQAQNDALGAMAQEAQHAEGELRREYGDKYEAKLRSVGAIADSLGIKDTLVSNGLGNNLAVIRMLDKLGSQMGESNLTGDARGSAGGFDQRLASLKSHPAAQSKGHPEYKAIQNQIIELYKSKYKD